MSPMMNIGFTGTRKGMTPAQRRSVIEVMQRISPAPVEAHHGACVGADAEFHRICWKLGVGVVLHPSDVVGWSAICEGYVLRHEPRPPLKRNRDIVDEVELLIAAPGGAEVRRSGTWSTIRYAKSVGVRVILVLPDGVRTEP